ncbi:phage tail protein [Pseudomonas panipatensis]|uniref:Microcystin-dependent protein n=1 Tax=Pseudomonas panipatensis TaxID=428992 RepID=A0A1G8IHB5_9PSED|nr:tail fiber protein [Pseudomonas panipatensis]SDI18399.1 Microcystin-dependent protein [Pseudomonas panipatensis]SMP73954.1 Microcystin-dependent protein [Pseudomonas panipatensis]
MEAFMGTIQIFGFNFPPRGWATCSGQLLSIAQNSALFALLGTQYGGNGQTTYGLPNLQGRLPIGQGQGQSTYVIGQVGGVENATLLNNNMPMHSHAVNIGLANTATNPVNAPTASNSFIGASGVGQGSASIYSSAAGSAPVPLQGVSVGEAGGGQPFSVMNPYLALNFCICLEGIFPSRN